MKDKKLVQYLELMKKDIYLLSNKVSQLTSEVKSDNTQEILQTTKLDRIGNYQEKIIDTIKTLNRRLSNLESRAENSDERVEDIYTEFITYKQFLNKKNKKNKSSTSYTSDSEIDVGEEVFSKISEIEEHFNSEIAKVYDKMFNEILDLKSEIEKNN